MATTPNAAARIQAVLQRIPDNPVEGAHALVDAAAGDYALTVLRLADLEWTAIAGDPAQADQSRLAALECGAGPLVDHGVTCGHTAIVCAPSTSEAPLDVLRQAAVWLELLTHTSATSDDLHALSDEADVLRMVAKQILTAQHLDQVLLSISNQTLRMLESDICGVFLLEGDELRMRSCTGHRVVTTSRLRMRRGQGVAGLVLETGEVAKVDSYLHDSTISSDFMSLAKQESTRSALAVPLFGHGTIIGVLEVWRRRYSLFSDRDVSRLVALADLASIAIENGRLYDSQRTTVEELDATRVSLEWQLGLLNRSAQLQQQLLDIVLANSAVAGAVARILGTELGCEVAIAAADGDIEAAYPRTLDATSLIDRALGEAGNLPQRATRIRLDTDRSIWAHPVIAADNQYGAVFLRGDDSSAELMSIACGQAAMVCSLGHMQQRAASAARAEALDQLLWDLLDGTNEQRAAARTRCHQMGVRLRGAHRVVYGVLDNLDALAAREGWNTSSIDALRRQVLDGIRNCISPATPTLSGLRGNWIVALAPISDRDRARTLLDTFGDIVHKAHPDLSASWGISTPCTDPATYTTAFTEAKTANAAARRLGTVSLYDELGIVRLLLGSGNSPDFQAFINEITRPLSDYDATHDGALLQTLRAFFDANCSQKDAAHRLYVHPKTLAYRLDLIRKLTGLDLSQHADRMRADLALRLLEVSETISQPPRPGP
ncbi:helix-turn-helix domain-containing protein [Nocardia jiangxiensis]|uniref:helix-turn-helix domain-containing protein n=1 Tax=Nocardia jiangxiensis TaxID=282685 RepID=UPI0003069B85|nr:helix-turn-helix domain-containing protein [Nocardia jiangxiensis]